MGPSAWASFPTDAIHPPAPPTRRWCRTSGFPTASA